MPELHVLGHVCHGVSLDDVVDLQDHLDDLGGQLELLFLGREGLVDLQLCDV